MPHLRIGEGVGDVVDRADRHARLFERGEEIRALVLLGLGVQQLDQQRAIFHPVGVGAKARIVGEFLPAEHLAKTAVLAVIADRR